MVQSGQDTSPDVVKGLEGPRSHISRQYHVRDVPKNTISGSFGPLEASRGLWRPNQTDNSRNQSCVGHVGGVWKQLVGSGGPKGPSKAIQVPKSQRNPLKYSNFQKKNPLIFFFFLSRRVLPSAAGTSHMLCCKCAAPQARSAGAQHRRAAQARSAECVQRRRRSATWRHCRQQEARGTSAARVTSVHP